MRFLGLLLLIFTNVAFAGESAVLISGSRLHVDRHEIDGPKVRLYNGTGYIEMDAARVQCFEADELLPSEHPTDPAAVPIPPAVTIPVPADSPALTPQQLADAAADKYGLPRHLVRSVILAESAFQPQAVSPKGAIGLMQLMPGTAATLGVNPHDPVQNVDAGARYLRDLLLKYDGLLWHALAAYNAGPGAVAKYKGVPPYRETINYINRIDRDFNKGN